MISSPDGDAAKSPPAPPPPPPAFDETRFPLAWVSMCDLRFVDWAKRLLQPSKGHTYGRSPVCILTCVLRLKSREKRFPHPSNVHYKRDRGRVGCISIDGTRVFISYHERFFAGVNQLMTLQLRTLHERFATFGAHVHSRSVRVQVLSHRRVVAKHLVATLDEVHCSFRPHFLYYAYIPYVDRVLF